MGAKFPLTVLLIGVSVRGERMDTNGLHQVIALKAQARGILGV